MPEKSGPKGDAETGTLKDALLPANHVPRPTADRADGEAEPAAGRATPPAPERDNTIPMIVGIAIVAGLVIMGTLSVLKPARNAVTGLTAPPAPVAEVAPAPDAALSVAGDGHNHDEPEAEPIESASAAAAAPAVEAAVLPASPTSTLFRSKANKKHGYREEGEPLTDWVDPGPMSLAQMREQRLIIDVHEHIESLVEAPLFLKAMDQFGIQTMCLMGSSRFTLTLNEAMGFTGYDENNEELLKIVKAFPGRFEAWPTLDPADPDKLKKIQDYVARGATGVKLYAGHGYVTKKHDYIFHPVAMDDASMLPFYAWCEDNFIPIVLHVNPYKDKKGFAEEFVAVLTQFPNMKVVAPHFILSSKQSNRLEELLDTFPNLYSDVSFGDYFMKERLTYISEVPGKFRRIFKEYPDRFMFATDLVMIKGRKDDWAPTQIQAYIDMLTKEKYTSPAIPGVELNGLALDDELLSRILFRNYHAFRKYRPMNSKPALPINWTRMSVTPQPREPGQAFPPLPKQKGGAE